MIFETVSRPDFKVNVERMFASDGSPTERASLINALTQAVYQMMHMIDKDDPLNIKADVRGTFEQRFPELRKQIETQYKKDQEEMQQSINNAWRTAVDAAEKTLGDRCDDTGRSRTA